MNGSTEWKLFSDFSFLKERWNALPLPEREKQRHFIKEKEEEGASKTANLCQGQIQHKHTETSHCPRTAYIRIMPGMCACRWSGLWLMTVVWRYVHRANICMCLSLFMLMLASGGFSQTLPSDHKIVCRKRNTGEATSVLYLAYQCIPTQRRIHTPTQTRKVWNKVDRNPQWGRNEVTAGCKCYGWNFQELLASVWRTMPKFAAFICFN